MALTSIGGHVEQVAQEATTVILRTRDRTSTRIGIKALILPHLGLSTQQLNVDPSEWPHLSGLDLADPNFREATGVDLLLGNEVYTRILLEGIKRLTDNAPIAQNSRLGWLVFGPTNQHLSKVHSLACIPTKPLVELNETLQRFWELEEPTRQNEKQAEEEEIERIFQQGLRRESSGQYIVRLPFKGPRPSNLSSTLGAARNSLKRIRKQMSQDPKFAAEYQKFMRDYLNLGHMKPIPVKHLEQGGPRCYLPHHGIWQRADEGQKLRVVFNASSRPRSGPSLNEQLHIGSEQLDLDLMKVITLWRLLRVVFGTDIKHMYRRVKVDERDIDYQRILWFDERDGSELHYWLLTVTYGVACAPYLALRVISQLIDDEGQRFPVAARIVKQAKYMDDIYGGADTLEEARAARDEVISLLTAGGFPQGKWISNCPALIEDLPAEDLLRPAWKEFDRDQPVMTLGIAWDSVADVFRYRVPAGNLEDACSKRAILAAIARIFDPMGWVSPIIIIAKILMQDLWRQKLAWDDRLPKELAGRWRQFAIGLKTIAEIKIPRWLNTNKSDRLRLHGFADASQKAFAACVYVQSLNLNGERVSHLVASKTRVAPVKTQTIPRLELCAAALLAELLQRVASWFGERVAEMQAWTDSNITLAWLEAGPSRWPIFIANRVSQVQRSLPGVKWRYVPSDENPADLATRGVKTERMASSELWWRGPCWLNQPSSNWPQTRRCHALSGELIQREVPTPEPGEEEDDFLIRFSRLTDMLRIVARCRRWLRITKPQLGTVSGPILARELSDAFTTVTRRVQSQAFGEEINLLKQNKPVGKRSTLKSLYPFLDSEGTLRVGGRLSHSALPFEHRHPPILPKKGRLAQLVLDRAHRTAMHGGPTLTYAHAIRIAWIIGGRGQARAHVRNCVQCTRARARPQEQLMGSLPEARVTPGTTFEKVGLDYAGPFALKAAKGRGVLTTKGYLAVFVCLKTKAVHLEVVGDLTTPSFIEALRRFSDRRDFPAEIWSDNATTFHGADRELRNMFREAKLDWAGVERALANDGIQWRFIPPGAPHFGGPWEAAVKSAKTHLKKIVADRHLTYEEMTSLACHVESCLNSRPLLPVNGTVDDLKVLTPRDFLTNEGGRWPAEVNDDATESLQSLSHWKLIKAMRNRFWKRWSHEYLHTLQQRAKWQTAKENISVGDVVLLLDPSLLVGSKWPLGRITRTHPGRDGRVRVATVKMLTGEYVRPLAKLCRLPIQGPDGHPTL